MKNKLNILLLIVISLFIALGCEDPSKNSNQPKQTDAPNKEKGLEEKRDAVLSFISNHENGTHGKKILVLENGKELKVIFKGILIDKATEHFLIKYRTDFQTFRDAGFKTLIIEGDTKEGTSSQKSFQLAELINQR